MIKNKKAFLVLLTALIVFFTAKTLLGHCQVPCGIYDDKMRIQMLYEHITTIEKAMNQVIALSKEAAPNYNQIVRWVVNKEKHAEDMDQIVSYYFLTQRIKPVAPDDKKAYAHYRHQLELLHHLLVFTMKAKQSTDLSLIQKLRDVVKKFEQAYFKPHHH
jgi:nickel superoxide dismutase